MRTCLFLTGLVAAILMPLNSQAITLKTDEGGNIRGHYDDQWQAHDSKQVSVSLKIDGNGSAVSLRVNLECDASAGSLYKLTEIPSQLETLLKAQPKLIEGIETNGGEGTRESGGYGGMVRSREYDRQFWYKEFQFGGVNKRIGRARLQNFLLTVAPVFGLSEGNLKGLLSSMRLGNTPVAISELHSEPENLCGCSTGGGERGEWAFLFRRFKKIVRNTDLRSGRYGALEEKWDSEKLAQFVAYTDRSDYTTEEWDRLDFERLRDQAMANCRKAMEGEFYKRCYQVP